LGWFGLVGLVSWLVGWLTCCCRSKNFLRKFLIRKI
jgi:hypothetical protein